MRSGRYSVVRRRPRALIVDDDTEVRRAVSRLLVEEGFLIHGASNGAEALAALEAGLRPSVTLLDLRMPVLDGWSTIARIHRSPHRDQTRIIVFTSAGDRSILPLRAAIDAYLPKPIDPAILLKTVHGLVSGSTHLIQDA